MQVDRPVGDLVPLEKIIRFHRGVLLSLPSEKREGSETEVYVHTLEQAVMWLNAFNVRYCNECKIYTEHHQREKGGTYCDVCGQEETSDVST